MNLGDPCYFYKKTTFLTYLFIIQIMVIKQTQVGPHMTKIQNISSFKQLCLLKIKYKYLKCECQLTSYLWFRVSHKN